MKTFLIITAVIAVGPYLAILFVWAAVLARLRTRKKRERARAMVLLSQVPKGAMGVLLTVFSAFKLQNVEEANRQTARYESETNALLEVLARPRDPSLSAGGTGDRLNLTEWQTELLERGYSEKAAAIIAAVHHHYLDAHLEELIKSRRWDSAAG